MQDRTLGSVCENNFVYHKEKVMRWQFSIVLLDMKIKDMDISMRPREKAVKYGMEVLSDRELLCLLLGSGTAQKSVEQLADAILKKTRNLQDLTDITAADLMSLEGIGTARALSVLAGVHLSRRSLQARVYARPVKGVEDVREWFEAEFGTKAQEHFVCLYLDSRQEVIDHRVLFIGTLNKSMIHPRDIFRQAFACNASCILLMHNHPSNDPTPSPQDLETTRALCRISSLVQIPVIDHVIVGRNTCFSFKAHSLLN